MTFLDTTVTENLIFHLFFFGFHRIAGPAETLLQSVASFSVYCKAFNITSLFVVAPADVLAPQSNID